MDEIICGELRFGDRYGCATLEEKRNVIMSLWPKINAGNQAGRSALGDAIHDRNLELTKYLIKNGADTTNMDGSRRTAVMRAIQYDSPDIAIYLVEQGHGHFDFREKWSTDTELLLAVGKGYYNVVKSMVEHGRANVNFSNKHGDTPLMRAVRKGHFGIAEYLVGQGAYISAENDRGEKAQDFVEDGLREMRYRVERLLKKN